MPKHIPQSTDGYEIKYKEQPKVFPTSSEIKATTTVSITADIEDCAGTFAASALVKIPSRPERNLSIQIAERDADLSICPKPLDVDKEHKHISLGDVHGNVMKLIYTLIEEGFLVIEEKEYYSLNYIYETSPDELDRTDINMFKDILDSAKVNKDKSITIIGDELSDRGNNDWFMLLLLKKLHEAQLDIDILISNHSVDFIRRISRIGGSIDPAVTSSYENMKILYANGIISSDEILDVVTNHYILMVKALNYSISLEEELTIYSHAPVGLETVEALARKLNVDYDEKNPASIMRTIDNINKKTNELLVNGELAQLLKQEADSVYSLINGKAPIPPEYPFIRLIWNRGLGKELRMKSKDGSFEIKDVHGHIGRGPIMAEDGLPSPNHQNLDNYFGKGSNAQKAAIGSRIQHFTRRSPENPVNTLKYQLHAILAEIKVFKTDRTMDEFIAEQELLISNAADKERLLKIKVIVEVVHKDLVEPHYLKAKCLEILGKIKAQTGKEHEIFVINYLEVIALETDKTILQEINNALEISLNRLALNTILAKIEIYPIEGMGKYVVEYIQKINDANSCVAIAKIKEELDTELSRIVFLYKFKRSSKQMLADIAKFKGMEAYVAEQKLVVDLITDKDSLEHTYIALKEKLSWLVIDNNRTKAHAMLDALRIIYKKNKPSDDVDSWVERQKKIIDEISDIDILEQHNSSLEKKLSGLNLRAKIQELTIKTRAMLADLKADKFVEDQHITIKTALDKVRFSSEDSCLNEVIIEVSNLIEIIAEKKAAIDFHKGVEGTMTETAEAAEMPSNLTLM